MPVTLPLPLLNRLNVRDLPRLFQTDSAGSLVANYLVRLRTEDGEFDPWTFTVYNGQCGLIPGDDLNADVVLTCDDASLDELISGTVDLPTLYAQRRLAIKGDIDLVLKFPRLFGL